MVHSRIGVAMAGVVLLAAACSAGGSKSTSSSAGRVTSTSAQAATTTEVADALVAAQPSAACGEAGVEVAPGEQRVELPATSGERWYLRHVPPTYEGRDPLPLVVDFHGYSEGAQVHAAHSDLGAYGDEQGFVTVTPQGSGPVPLWNVSLGSADLEFVGELLDHVEAAVCVDRARVFATGLSNGAMMTSAVACALAERIAAVAPVAGVADIDRCAPARAVPVVAFHGTADPYLPYEGGFGPAVADLPAPDGSGTLGGPGALDEMSAESRSVPDAMAAWAGRNGCDTEPSPDRVAADVVRLVFVCPAGAEVELYRIDGGGHSWPGSEFSRRIEDVVGPTTFSIAANEVMWKFFTEHPLR